MCLKILMLKVPVYNMVFLPLIACGQNCPILDAQWCSINNTTHLHFSKRRELAKLIFYILKHVKISPLSYYGLWNVKFLQTEPNFGHMCINLKSMSEKCPIHDAQFCGFIYKSRKKNQLKKHFQTFYRVTRLILPQKKN